VNPSIRRARRSKRRDTRPTGDVDRVVGEHARAGSGRTSGIALNDVSRATRVRRREYLLTGRIIEMPHRREPEAGLSLGRLVALSGTSRRAAARYIEAMAGRRGQPSILLQRRPPPLKL
jgi:hypothetical protein